jgi:hypothetical protein
MSGLLFYFASKFFLPTVDTLRNLFYAPTAEMKITFDLLRQGSRAG